MFSISSGDYKEELKKCNSFIEEADKFMNTNWAILKGDSVNEMVKQGKVLEGEMGIFKKALVSNSNMEPKYEAIINKIDAKTQELEKYWKEFGVKSINIRYLPIREGTFFITKISRIGR